MKYKRRNNITRTVGYFRHQGLSIVLVIILLFADINGSTQDSSSIHTLLKQIHDQQVQADPFFMKGVFPSYVSNKRIYNELRKDNNVFYNAVICYTLKTLKPGLNPGDQVIVDSIIARSERLSRRFRNNTGRESYNFWRTDSSYRLPYLWGMRITKKNMLDDDQDCTSMCLLSFNAPVITAQKAHFIMQDFTNDTWNPAPNTPRNYQLYPAYTTWLGNKLPPVMDVCVISNVLSFVQSYGLTWSKADSASLDLLITAIKNDDHIKRPLIIAPYYGTTSIILYHLARLMSIKPIPQLESLKDKLIRDALDHLQKTNSDLEKIIVSNALLKWDRNVVVADVRAGEIEKSNFPFFLGNIPSIFHRSIQKPLSKKGIGVYYHYCPAFNNVLLLEYLVLKNGNMPGLASGSNNQTDPNKSTNGIQTSND